MKLKMESIQTYEDHKEKIKNEYECSVEKVTECVTKIKYENNTIIIEENKVTYNDLIIERNRETENIYKTEHGEILMKIKCLEMKIRQEQVRVTMKYEIKIGDRISYINDIEINVI